MAPKYTLVAFISLLTMVLYNVFYGLNFSAIEFGFNYGTHLFLCKASHLLEKNGCHKLIIFLTKFMFYKPSKFR